MGNLKNVVAVLLAIGCLTAVVSSAGASTIIYGTPGEELFNNGDWSNYVNAREGDVGKFSIAKGDYVHFYFNATIGAWNDRYDHGAAIRWEAPEGEVITSITFTVLNANGNGYYKSVVSTPATAGDTNILDNTVLWEQAGVISASSPVTETLTFTEAEGITSIELGMRGRETYVGFQTRYDDVSITTVPEPMSLLVFALGILGIRSKK